MLNNIEYLFDIEPNSTAIVQDVLITEDVANKILNISITKEIDIRFLSCVFEFQKSNLKIIEQFLDKFQIENSIVCLPNKASLNSYITYLIGNSNKVIYTSYIHHLIDIYENDLRNLPIDVLKKIKLSDVSLKNTLLPENNEWLQLIYNKEVSNVAFPQTDFTKFNILGVYFKDCTFAEKTVFGTDFFQKIKCKRIFGCKFPAIDFTNINIDGCYFLFIRFDKKTTFPESPDFFCKFKSLYSCTLPPKDYTIYNFLNSNITYCTFAEKSILPYSQSLADNMFNNHYPKKYASLVYILPIKDIDCNDILTRFGKLLSNEQKAILYMKEQFDKN